MPGGTGYASTCVSQQHRWSSVARQTRVYRRQNVFHSIATILPHFVRSRRSFTKIQLKIACDLRRSIQTPTRPCVLLLTVPAAPSTAGTRVPTEPLMHSTARPPRIHPPRLPRTLTPTPSLFCSGQYVSYRGVPNCVCRGGGGGGFGTAAPS